VKNFVIILDPVDPSEAAINSIMGMITGNDVLNNWSTYERRRPKRANWANIKKIYSPAQDFDPLGAGYF